MTGLIVFGSGIVSAATGFIFLVMVTRWLAPGQFRALGGHRHPRCLRQLSHANTKDLCASLLEELGYRAKEIGKAREGNSEYLLFESSFRD